MTNNSCKCPYYCKNHGNCEQCQKNINDCSTCKETFCGKKRDIKEPEIKKPVWATEDELKGINPPVLENTINVKGHLKYNNYDLKFNENGRLLFCNNKIYDADNHVILKEILLSPYDVTLYNKIDGIISSSDIISYSEGTIIYFRTYKREVWSGDYSLRNDEVIDNEWTLINEKNGKTRICNCHYIYPNIKISSKYSRYLFDCSNKNYIIIWNSITKKCIFKVPLPSDDDEIISFDYSPIGKRFAVYQKNNFISTWHWESNEELLINNPCLECKYIKKSKDENTNDNHINYYCTNIDGCFLNCKNRKNSYRQSAPLATQ